MPQQEPSRRSGLQIFDRLLATGLLALTFLFGCFRQMDADIWWHLKTGQLILQRGEWPQKDWFTFTSTDRDWIDLHWLFQVGAAKLFEFGGLQALTLASATLGMIAIALLLSARRSDWPWVWSVSCWFPVLFLYSGRLYVRPEVLTLVCMAIFLTVLFHSDRHPKLLWLLVPVQIFWVNVQGLFVLGLVLVGFYWLDGVWRHLYRHRSARIPQRTAVLLVLVLACLINPYTIRGLLFPFELFRKMSLDAGFYSTHISELQSIRQFVTESGFRHFYVLVHFGLLALAIVSFPLAWSRGRLDIFRLFTFSAFAWLSLQASRNSGQFALVAGAVISWNLSEWAAARREERGSRGHRRESKDGGERSNNQDFVQVTGLPVPSPRDSSGVLRLVPMAERLALSVALLGTGWMVVNGQFYKFAGEGRLFGLGEHPLWHAHDAAKFAAGAGMPERLIAFHLGHAAVFEFHKRDDQRTFCDPRLEVVSRELLEEYHEIEDAIRFNRPDWKGRLGRQNLRMILTDHRGDFAVEATLLNDPEWRCVYFDPIAAVFLRQAASERQGPRTIDFAARLFTHDKLPEDVWAPQYADDPSVAPDPASWFRESEALILIARSLVERPPVPPQKPRELLLLAHRLALGAAPRNAEEVLRRRRLLGQVAFFQAVQSDQNPLAPRFALEWDASVMLNVARAAGLFELALVARKDDFISLTYSYQLAAMTNDIDLQDGIYRKLVARHSHQPNERNVVSRITEERRKLTDRPAAQPEPYPAGPPKDISALMERVDQNLHAGHFNEVSRLLEHEEHGGYVGQKFAPIPWYVYDRLGYVFMVRGAAESARSVWKTPSAVGWDDGVQLERTADTYLVKANYDKAIQIYREALTRSPGRPQARWGLVRALLEAGDANGVVREAECALRDNSLSDFLRSEFVWMHDLALPYQTKGAADPAVNGSN